MEWRFWRKSGHISKARAEARRAIDSQDAARLDALFDSADPVQALAASLEYNFNESCCKPGRLFTLGKIQVGGGGLFRCTHCDHHAGPYWEKYWSEWFEYPSLSPAGERRRPDTAVAAEAIRRMKSGMKTLLRNDPVEMSHLLAGRHPVAFRIFIANAGHIRQSVPEEQVLDNIIQSRDSWRNSYEAADIMEIGEEIMVKLGMIEGTYMGIRLEEEIERRQQERN